MTENELTKAIWEAINQRYRSPEHLATLAHLAPGTVRNILRSGSGAPESLLKLAPFLNRTAFEVFVLAGWLAPTPGEYGSDAEEAARLVEATPPHLRRMLMAPLRATAHELQQESALL